MEEFGLIGHPLTHSFSRTYFSEKFRKEGLHHCRYENFPLASIDLLPDLLRAHPQLRGLNVTIPYKEAVIPLLDECTETVREIGACNCISIQQGTLVGYNTDVVGFERTLVPHLQDHHRRALILGTGGAAKAVEYVLSRLDIAWMYVSRKPSVQHLSYEQVTPEVLASYPLVINTTPLGMFPNVVEAPPIPYEALTPFHLLYDLIYNPPETLFLKKGARQGATTVNGMDMLIIQAEESWTIWNS
ncbi:MAG TPA: shikimate dehydrogenase [Chitinophagaceae bacterium]|nr:shikimate dehydrogenase [Chitinophagaceae bacterium]